MIKYKPTYEESTAKLADRVAMGVSHLFKPEAQTEECLVSSSFCSRTFSRLGSSLNERALEPHAFLRLSLALRRFELFRCEGFERPGLQVGAWLSES